jgi:nucleotide-binding universal stress UspA family protein
MRVISVIPIIAPLAQTVPMSPTYYPSSVMYEELLKISRGRAKEALVRAHEILREAGIQPVKPESLPIGDAREIILDEAKNWGADLIALGSHGYRGIDRLMLGSVSESVAMHARCSVEVIREAAAKSNEL